MTLILNIENHTYHLDEEATIEFISVSTLVARYFHPFDTDKTLSLMKNSRMVEGNRYYGKTDDEIREMWKGYADKGTSLHAEIEKYYIGSSGIDMGAFPELAYFASFVRDHPEISIFRTEWRVFDKEMHIAGTIDAVFTRGNEYILVDWKRVKELKKENRFQNGLGLVSHLPDTNYYHYSLQVNIYKYLVEKNYGISIAEMWLVLIHPENTTYHIEKIPTMEKEMKALVEELK